MRSILCKGEENEEPYTIDYSKFVSEHLDCDSIIKDNSQNYSDIVQVIAFATKQEFNEVLNLLCLP